MPKTLAVGAQWVTSAKQDATLVYNITKALWNDNTRKARWMPAMRKARPSCGERSRRRRHSAAPGCREVLQGSRPDWRRVGDNPKRPANTGLLFYD